MSPRTRLVILALLIGVILTSLLYLMNIQFGFGYYSRSGGALIVVIIAFILYVLLTRIAEKLKKK